MVQEAVNPPSVVVAVMIAVPAAIPRTSPVDETVAMLVRLEDHETIFIAALLGRTVETSVDVVVRGSVSVVRLRETPDTGMKTRTITDADLFPSWLATVMMVDPFPTAVISPVFDTVAMDGCKDFKETVLLVAFAGRTVATD